MKPFKTLYAAYLWASFSTSLGGIGVYIYSGSDCNGVICVTLEKF